MYRKLEITIELRNFLKKTNGMEKNCEVYIVSKIGFARGISSMNSHEQVLVLEV